MTPRYLRSGKVSPRMLIALPALFLGSAVAGVVYELLLYEVPSQTLQALVPVAFAVGIAMLCHRTLEWAPSRNLAVSWGVTLGPPLIALAASYGQSYVGDYRAALGPTSLGEIWEKSSLASFTGFLEARIENGWTEMRNGREQTTTGAGVLLAWAIEALLLISFSVIGTKALRDRVFCESCGQVAERRGIPLHGYSPQEILSLIAQSGSLRETLLLPPRDRFEDGSRLALQRDQCPGCGMAYLTLEHIRLRKVGNRMVDWSKELLRRFAIDAETSEAFERHLPENQPEPEAVATA